MKNYWLHWIGAKLYSKDKFITEAQEYGVTRRVAPNVLKQLCYGDTVFCIQKLKKSDPWGSIFARFDVERMSGLSEKAVEQLGTQYEIEQTDPGGLMVLRECGSYITGPEYSIKATLSDIGEVLSGIDHEESKSLMVGCSPAGFQVMPKPFAMLYGVPFRQGFRLFNGKRFFGKYQGILGRYVTKHDKEPAVVRLKKDQFYAVPAPGQISNKGLIESVTDYTQESKTERAYQANKKCLIDMILALPLDAGELQVTPSGKKLHIDWTIRGKVVSSVKMSTALLREKPNSGTIQFLAEYALQTLKAKRANVDKAII